MPYLTTPKEGGILSWKASFGMKKSEVLLIWGKMLSCSQCQFARPQKIAFSGVFLTGGVGPVASIIRMDIYFNKSDAFNDPT
ncbi:MAG: hypothetical protein Q9217_000484 [Psora testacea]